MEIKMITNKTFPKLLFMLFVGSCVAISIIPLFSIFIGILILNKWPNMSRTVDEIIDNTCALGALLSYIVLIHISLWFVIPLAIISLAVIFHGRTNNDHMMILATIKSLIFIYKNKYSVVYDENYGQNFIYYVKDGVIKKRYFVINKWTYALQK